MAVFLSELYKRIDIYNLLVHNCVDLIGITSWPRETDSCWSDVRKYEYKCKSCYSFDTFWCLWMLLLRPAVYTCDFGAFGVWCCKMTFSQVLVWFTNNINSSYFQCTSRSSRTCRWSMCCLSKITSPPRLCALREAMVDRSTVMSLINFFCKNSHKSV